MYTQLRRKGTTHGFQFYQVREGQVDAGQGAGFERHRLAVVVRCAGEVQVDGPGTAVVVVQREGASTQLKQQENKTVSPAP